jgi:hypothetical protein
MPTGAILRIARLTDNLEAIAAMYANGLDFTVLAQFHDHAGFDGVILGRSPAPLLLGVYRPTRVPGWQSAHQRSPVGLLPSGSG